MDRFKFRVWDKKKNSFNSAIDFWAIDEFGDLRECGDERYYQWNIYVNEKDYIVEQCTGLKDKNGQLIYEGDVVAYSFFDDDDFDKPENLLIVWDKIDAKFHTSLNCYYGTDPLKSSDMSLTVIGNIHENPELLER